MRLILTIVALIVLGTACGDKNQNKPSPVSETTEVVEESSNKLAVPPCGGSNQSLNSEKINSEIYKLLKNVKKECLGDQLYGLDNRLYGPMDDIYSDTLLEELADHDCQIDLNFSTHKCDIPQTLQELDHLWEAAVHLHLLAYNHVHLTNTQARNADKISSQIKRLVEKEELFANYSAGNEKIREYLSENYNLDLNKVISIGSMKQRLSLLTLTQLSQKADFFRYLEKKNISEVFSHQNTIFHISDERDRLALLIGYRLSESDVMNKIDTSS